MTQRSAIKLAVAWCTLFVVGTDLFVLSPLLPLIAADLNLHPGSAGLSVTAFAVTYMLCAPLFGYLADRVGRRPTLLWCLVGFAAANLWTALAPSFGWLLAARVAAGAMTAGVSPSIYALVGESAPPHRRALWMAMAVSGLLLSLSLGASLGGLIGAAFGWAKVFDILAGSSLILVLANYRIWTGSTLVPLAGAAPGAAVATAAPRLLLTVVWATALYGMYTYLGAWLTRRGFSTAEIAEIIVWYGAGALVGTLGGGRFADRVGARTAIGVSLAGLAVCFLLLPLTLRPGLPIGLGFGVTSAVAQIFFPAQQAGLVGDFPTRRASVLAWNNSSLFLGIALGSLAGGQAMSHGSFEASLAGCAAIAFAGWLINWKIVPRPASA